MARVAGEIGGRQVLGELGSGGIYLVNVNTAIRQKEILTFMP